MRKPVSLALVILAGLSAGAFAATNMTITQKGRVFSSESVAIKKGEALTFVNDDTVPHNIVSTSKGVLSDRKARQERVGGELLCTVE